MPRHKFSHYLSSSSRALFTTDSPPEKEPGTEHATKAETDADD